MIRLSSVVMIALYVVGECHQRMSSSPVVKTSSGSVSGSVEVSRSGQAFLSFRSIPYAQPPVGRLRFANPRPIEAWTGVKNVTEDPPYCLQYNIISVQELDEEAFYGQEDCLFLSVFTRTASCNGRRGNRPVMVFIHGGGFETLTGSTLHGPEYFMDHDIVAVYINYRLGPFGFLSTEDSVMPGNFGLKDQLLALKWVRTNIGCFGGDPDQVTLFGQSAGAAAVHFHMKSLQSRGLFNRAVMNSGSVYDPWAIKRSGTALRRALRAAEVLSCPKDDHKSLLSCLRTKPASHIVKLRKQFIEWDTDPFVVFGPVVEKAGSGSFFTLADLERKTEGDLLVGGVVSEGAIKVAASLARNSNFADELLSDFETWAPLTFDYGEAGSTPDLTELIRRRYLNGFVKASVREPAFLINLTKIYSDSWFGKGLYRALMDHQGTYYRYRLDRKPQLPFVSILGAQYPEGVDGASHCDDLLYLFNMSRSLPVNPLNQEDKIMSRIMVTLWTNFITYGSPGGVWSSSRSVDDVFVITPDGQFLMTRNNDLESSSRLWIDIESSAESRSNAIVKKTKLIHLTS